MKFRAEQPALGRIQRNPVVPPSHLSCTSVPLLWWAEQGPGFWLCWRPFAETVVGEKQRPCISLQQEELLERGIPLGVHGLPPETCSKLSEDGQIELPVSQVPLPQTTWRECVTRPVQTEITWALLDGQTHSKYLRSGRLRFFNWECHPKASSGV